ncbi:NACHT domain-containing protein [Actinokineospora globicatena]|uniref:NACHT domain-containing protein n=1 Tax=Actinokineospora globicatena TaxID=103729 RepID=UPI0020A57127|nr:NACHT domain-containing protein [Actinokineospora globicatena]MCP2303527.1 NACHT domain-containing protein [Actinokineospora globicatena]GLW79336.1 hypothetical protein Aglo01_38180 [Actinokineospora globicatena]GLW86254.1 hypothetical protein Aglo02_38930 [Actinokineospora globicatena]
MADQYRFSISGNQGVAVQARDISGGVHITAPSADPLDVAVRELAAHADALSRQRAIVEGWAGSTLEVRWDVDSAHHTGTTDISTSMGELARTVLAGPYRGLVLLGQAGTGKTTMAALLMPHLREESADHVAPVLLPLADWDPDRDHAHTWIVQGVRALLPGAAASASEHEVAALLAKGRIIPVLDGLDEMPAARQAVAITRLNVAFDQGAPIVLTSRPPAYDSTPGLRGAMVLRARPLTAAAINTYLRNSVEPSRTRLWDDVLDSVTPGSPLALALSTPLMVWAVHTGYVRTMTDPTPLLDLADRDTAERHLLDKAVTEMVADRPPILALPPGRDRARPPVRWPAHKSRRWLCFLTDHLRGTGHPAIEWWRLKDARASVSTTLVLLLIMPIGTIWTSQVLLHPARAGDTASAGEGLAFGAAIGLIVELIAVILRPHPIERPSGRPGIRGLAARLEQLKTSTAARPGWTAVAIVALLAAATYFAVSRQGGAAAMATAAAILVALGVGRAALGPPNEAAASDPPRRTLAADRDATALACTAATSVVAAVTALAGQWNLLWAAAAWSAVILSSSPWGRWGMAKLILAVTGRLPLRTMAFLDQMADRGMLRRIGGAHEFRHDRLREHLTAPGSATNYVVFAVRSNAGTLLQAEELRYNRRRPWYLLAMAVFLTGFIWLDAATFGGWQSTQVWMFTIVGPAAFLGLAVKAYRPMQIGFLDDPPRLVLSIRGKTEGAAASDLSGFKVDKAKPGAVALYLRWKGDPTQEWIRIFPLGAPEHLPKEIVETVRTFQDKVEAQ